MIFQLVKIRLDRYSWNVYIWRSYLAQIHSEIIAGIDISDTIFKIFVLLGKKFIKSCLLSIYSELTVEEGVKTLGENKTSWGKMCWYKIAAP